MVVPPTTVASAAAAVVASRCVLITPSAAKPKTVRTTHNVLMTTTSTANTAASFSLSTHTPTAIASSPTASVPALHLLLLRLVTSAQEMTSRPAFGEIGYALPGDNFTMAVDDPRDVPAVNSSNASQPLMNAPTFNEVSLMKAVVFGVMFVISLVGNVATLMQMYRLRRRRSTINTLIVNLAIADLLVTFFCIAGEAVWAATVQWLAGNATCKIVKYMQVFALYLSTYITIAISLDRCIAIVDPMRRQWAAHRVRIMIAASWLLSAVFSVPQAIVFHVLRGPFKEEFYQCVTFGTYQEEWQRQAYSVASLLLMFILPLAIIGSAYVLIFTTISRKSREVSVMESMSGNSRKPWIIFWHSYRRACLCGDQCDRALSREDSIISSCNTAATSVKDSNGRGPVRSNLLRRARRKSLRMSIVIVLAFIVCWSPYYTIFTVCITFLEWEEIDPKTLLWFSFIGLSNSMLNPIIYGAFQLCKVHRHRPWRRDEWPASSLKLTGGCRLRKSGHPLLGPAPRDTRANNGHAPCRGGSSCCTARSRSRSDGSSGTPRSSSSCSTSSSLQGPRGGLRLLCRCESCLHHRRQQVQVLSLRSSPVTQESALASPAKAAGDGEAEVPSPQRCTRFTHKHFVTGEACRCCSFHSY